jgi:ribosomal protein S18 acetylase RimI-like enzyme
LSFVIRNPDIDEAEALAKVHVQSWQETYAGILPQAYLDSLRCQEREPMWRAAISHPDRHVAAAFDGEKAAAVSLAGLANEFDAVIADGQLYVIYVLRSHQRRGLGRKLIADAAQYWQDRSGNRLGLLVLTANRGACSFYEALGARVVLTQKCSVAETPLEETLYVFEDLAKLSSL